MTGGADWSDNVVYGNLGNDTMAGSGGIDWIRGGQGNDNIAAGDGADLIWGDRGDDTIQGNGGADVFSIFGEAGLDRILDFNYAEGDRLKVEAGYTYSVVEYGNDVVVTLSGGSAQAWLVGVQLSKLPAGWII
jgi:Ca2+-binding RTX toxin-like protein